jgi:hypothetical protein
MTQTVANNMPTLEEIKELNLEKVVKDAQEGEICVVNKILKGKLTDLIPLVRDPANLSQRAMDFIQRRGEDIFYLIHCTTREGRNVKLLVRQSFDPKSTFYNLMKKYHTIKVGDEIVVFYNPEKRRYDFLL